MYHTTCYKWVQKQTKNKTCIKCVVHKDSSSHSLEWHQKGAREEIKQSTVRMNQGRKHKSKILYVYTEVQHSSRFTSLTPP